MDISIVIVSWNVRKLLKQCLLSIQKYTGDLKIEIIVVDNASKDESTAMVQSEFPNVKIVANATNKGFAAANNQGIKISSGRYVLLLNPDTEIRGQTLQRLIAFADANQKAGVIGGKHLNPDLTLQQSVRRLPTIGVLLLLLFKVGKLFPNLKTLQNYYATNFNYSKPQTVEQVAGSCFLIRRDVLEKVGNLDERFFIWFEEVDYCRRVAAAGWQIWYYADAEIIHYGGQSFAQQMTLKKQWLFFKSALQYLLKPTRKNIKIQDSHSRH
jgi:hypothetical protein